MLGAGAVGFALLGVATSSWVLVAGTALIFCLGWAWPGLFNFVFIELLAATPAAATRVTGTGIFTGGIFGPLGFGAGRRALLLPARLARRNRRDGRRRRALHGRRRLATPRLAAMPRVA
jgi:hypothetical protein